MSKVFFEKVIAAGDIIVFQQQQGLAGYVLVNSVLPNPHIQRVKQQYFAHQSQRIAENIAFSYQFLIDDNLQGTGFFYDIQNSVYNFFKAKFMLIVTTIDYKNVRSVKAHQKAGWNFYETDAGYYIIEMVL